jgi:uncharacterized protein
MSDSGPLESLYRVQQFDLELDRSQAEELRIPDELAEARTEQGRINNDLEDAEIELEGVSRRVRAQELDLTSTQEQIARNKSEQQKNAFDAKLQSQYENVIQQLQERVGEYEEALVPLHERQSGLEERASGLRAEHAALRPKIAEMERQDEVRVQGLRDAAEGTRQERDTLAGSIDGRLVKEYTLIRKAKKGLGIVPVEGGRCTGCNMNLPVTVQQRVALGKLPAVKCPSCGRFLIKLAPGN